jgi:MFS family permease
VGLRSSTRTLYAVAAGTFLVTFDGSAVQMILPALRRELHTSISVVQWTMTAFLLVSTCAYLPAGRFGDRRGRGRVWRAGLVVFLIGSAACALAPGVRWLILARALQALGAAALTANSAPLLIAAFPQARGRALGLGSVAIAAGLLAGPALGAILTHLASWRLLFVVALPGGLLAAGLAHGRLPTERARPGRGILPHHLGGRLFLSGALASLFSYLSLFMLTVAVPFFLLDVQHRSLVRSGLLVALVPAGLALSAPLAGRLSDRVGARPVCAAGMSAVTAGILVGVTLRPDAAWWQVGVGLLLAGLGLGAFEAPNSAAALSSVSPSEMGAASAALGVMRNLGMAAGTALGAALLGDGTAHAIRRSLACAAAVALFTVLLVSLSTGRGASPAHREAWT